VSWREWIYRRPGWAVRLWILVRSWFFPPAPEFNSAFIDATEWARNYAPGGEPETYAIVAKFAETQYSSMVSLSDGLDKKADELVRFTVTIAGAVTAAASTGKLIKFHRPEWAAVAFLFVAASVYCAMRVRTPTATTIPMSSRDLLKIADLDTKPTAHQIESVVAATYHVATVGLGGVTNWKSNLLRRSTVAFFAGFILLFASILPF
jgi:hypothetical protein